ncbi:MAG: MMPL family transporter [Granulosicoccaceae bacterium]
MTNFYHRQLHNLAEWAAHCTTARSTLLLFVVALISLLFVTQLQVQHGTYAFFESDSSEFTAHRRYTDLYPAEQQDLLLLTQFKPDSVSWLNRFHRFHVALEQTEGVAHVISVLSAATQSADVIELPGDGTAVDRLVSQDKHSTLLVVSLDSDLLLMPANMSQAIEHIAATAEQYNMGLQFAGLPALRLELRQQVLNDVWLFATVGTLFALVLIWLTLRQWVTAALILLGPLIAVAATLGLMALIGVSLNVLTQMLVVLIVVIGASDSLHLAHRLIHMRQAGLDQAEALRQCVIKVVPACLLTSLTTAIGFASLLVSQSAAVQEFGFAGFIGSVVVVAVVLMSLPLLAASCYRAPARHVKSVTDGQATKNHFANRCTRFVHRVVELRIVLSLVAGLMAAIMLTASINNEATYEVGENLPHDSAYIKTVDRLRDEFGGGYTLVVLVEPVVEVARRGVLLEQVDHVQQGLNASFEKPWTSIRDLIRATPGGGLNSRLRILPNYLQNRFWDPKNTGSAILTYTLDSHDKQDIAAAVARTRAVLQHSITSDGWHYSVAGFVAIASSASELILTELLKSLLLAMALIVIVCLLVFRKLNWAFMVLLPTAFPILGITFVLSVVGEPIRYVYALLFSVCFGLSVDSAIHILNTYRQHLVLSGNPARSMGHALSITLQPLLLATIVVVVGFVVLTLSASPTLSMVGVLGAVALSCALLSALILIPMLLDVPN